jgi:hypothetical protein
MPVEQMDRHLLILNLRTARAIGVEVLPAMLARADESDREAIQLDPSGERPPPGTIMCTCG